MFVLRTLRVRECCGQLAGEGCSELNAVQLLAGSTSRKGFGVRRIRVRAHDGAPPGLPFVSVPCSSTPMRRSFLAVTFFRSSITIRVAFSRPVTTADEVREEMVALVQRARAQLGG